MKRVAIIAALEGEVKPLVQGWKKEQRNGVSLYRWRHDEGEWVAAFAGMGVERAIRALAEVRSEGEPSLVMSAGWAGALTDECKPGSAYHCSAVIDLRTGERFSCAHFAEERVLLTSAAVAGQSEKARLAQHYKAALVDMEAAGIARIASAFHLPFHVIKAVSDGPGENLPDFNGFIGMDGQLQLGKFIFHVLWRPKYWPALIRMSENSKNAAHALCSEILDFLDERGYIRERNGYPGYK